MWYNGRVHACIISSYMEIEEFVKKRGIVIEDRASALFQEGLRRMAKSRDPLHGGEHVRDMIAWVDRFLENEEAAGTGDKDFSVLLPAIAWHDAWKAGKKQTTSLIKLKFVSLWDGYGSMRLFRGFADRSGFSGDYAAKIAECVYFHAPLRQKAIGGKKFLSTEAKILRDLDNLDMWSLKRLDIAKKAYCDEEGVFFDKRMARIAYAAFRQMRARAPEFHFSWPRRTYESVRPEWLRRSEEVVRKNLPLLYGGSGKKG